MLMLWEESGNVLINNPIPPSFEVINVLKQIARRTFFAGRKKRLFDLILEPYFLKLIPWTKNCQPDR